MNEASRRDARVLLDEIAKTKKILVEIDKFFKDVHENDLATLGRTRSTALIIAQILENYYTCVETMFFRISQFFENSLCTERWHADLLDKMALSINGIRPAVIRDETYSHLRELMRFRHFKRYYFELDYDWSKLDYLTTQYEHAKKQLEADMSEFSRFLGDLLNEIDE